MTSFSTAKGILMSAPMSRALRDGVKTQTRREGNLKEINELGGWNLLGQLEGKPRMWGFIRDSHVMDIQCPWVVGGALYVKEACWVWGAWHKNGLTKTGKQQCRFKPVGQQVSFDPQQTVTRESGETGWVKRNSIFMPRWAARIYLEITGVRVERLQDISEEDCIAEGIERMKSGRGFYDAIVGKGAVHLGVYHNTAREAYKFLFEGINGKGSWESNPWVFVISVKVVAS